jgi:glycosyltransferase involved in cell wall biosynthesis
VWIPGRGAAWQEAERLGLIPLEFDAERALGAAMLRAAIANLRVGMQLRHGRPGLVHVHGPLFYGALRHALGLSGLQRVVHVHIEEDPVGLQWAFQRPPDLIITCANFLVEHVRQALPEVQRERQRILAVPNAVDTTRYFPGDKKEAKARIGALADQPLLLMLANLAAHKGQETALRALAVLQRRGRNVVCWLAGTERGGTGPYTDRLHALAAELGVAERVRFLGQRGDAPDLLRAADFLLLPSTHEGLPLSILEAQASRVPVLAAPSGGVAEVVEHGTTGFLIPAQDASAYASAMALLLDQPQLYESIVDNAYEQVRRQYGWDRFLDRVRDLYTEVCGALP